MCLSTMTVICIKQNLSKFEAQFMKKFSISEAELKKVLLIKKAFGRFCKVSNESLVPPKKTNISYSFTYKVSFKKTWV